MSVNSLNQRVKRLSNKLQPEEAGPTEEEVGIILDCIFEGKEVPEEINRKIKPGLFEELLEELDEEQDGDNE